MGSVDREDIYAGRQASARPFGEATDEVLDVFRREFSGHLVAGGFARDWRRCNRLMAGDKRLGNAPP